MASKVKGISTQELINMSVDALNKMDEQTLRAAVSRMADAANKRVARIDKSGVSSQAVAALHRSGQEKFSTKGKDLNSLRAEYARIKGFMTSATGSVKNAKKVEKNVTSELSKRGIDINRQQYKNFWSAYEKLKERDPAISNKQLKYSVLQNIAAEMDEGNRSIDEIVNDISNRIEDIYEQTQDLTDDGVSRFFELS